MSTPEGTASSNDLALMQRIFSAAVQRPDQIPPEFLAYVSDFLATTNLTLPASQVSGVMEQLPLTVSASVTASQSTTSTSYADLGTVGPTTPSLRDGNYLVLFSARMSESATATTAFMSVQANAVTAVDGDAIQLASTSGGTVSGFTTVSLPVGTNTITAKYRTTGGTATFSARRLVVIRYANL